MFYICRTVLRKDFTLRSCLRKKMCTSALLIFRKNVTLKNNRSSNSLSKTHVLKNSVSQTCRSSAWAGTRMPAAINARPSVVGPVADQSCLARCLVRGTCIGQESSRSAGVSKDNSCNEVSRLS